MMIRVHLDIPHKYHRRAMWVLRVFSALWGRPVAFVGEPETADLVYGDKSRHRSDKPHLVPFRRRMYRRGTVCKKVTRNGRTLWVVSGDTGNGDSDLIGGAYRLLTLLDERQVSAESRDRRGIFASSALPGERSAIAQEPVVEHHAAALWQELSVARPQLADMTPLPRWPGGKKYAICLTHDVDAVRASAPLELLSNLAKYVIGRDGIRLRMVTESLRRSKGARDPFFAFEQWRQFEQQWAAVSTFYLFVRPRGIRATLNDCKSDVYRQAVDWEVLRSLADAGWEFGWHAPIRARDGIDAFCEAKQWLESKLKRPVFGLRHHYWALDWHNPHFTFRKQVNAGFRYDTSIAYRDIPGFRAACSVPYRPYDPGRDEPLGMYELPTCLMDGHIILADITAGRQRAAKDEAIQRGRSIIGTVKKHGGVAVLDWHQETGCNRWCYEGYVDVLREVLRPYLTDDDGWLTSPWELVQHWHQRAARLRGSER